jgi:hypothetical protein
VYQHQPPVRNALTLTADSPEVTIGSEPVIPAHDYCRQ